MKVMISKRGIGTTAKHAGNSVVAMAIVLVNQLPLSALVVSSHNDAADNVELTVLTILQIWLGRAATETTGPKARHSF